MFKFAALFALCASSLLGQSADTVYFRAPLLPSNEVPAVDIKASGWATIQAHVVRDASGQIVSGSVDFYVGYSFPSQVTITGLHIHNGPAGQNAGVVINSGVSGNNPVVSDSTGRGTINMQGQVLASDSAGLAALAGMLKDPSQYYVNLHTTDNPGGVIRGQLQNASVKVFMAMMSSANEVPPAGIAASGVARVTAIGTWDSSGKPTSAQLIFDVNYRFPNQVTFTGFHIHNGPAGANAGVIFNTGIGGGAASVQSDSSGVGSINRPVEVNVSDSTMVKELIGMWNNPSAYYINLHTTDFAGGAIRAQLRSTDTMVFPVTLQTSNEVPPVTGITAGAVGAIRVSTIRYEDGTVQAGAVTFDLNYSFPASATVTGMHIHDGAAGTNGPVRIDSGLSAGSPLSSAGGVGNVSRTVSVSADPALATLNTIVRAPENTYVNMHTPDNPGGVMRSQLAPANSAAPAITAVISANMDKNSTTLAPGGVITIFGTNLAKVPTDLSGWQGTTIPDILNGVAVAIGDVRAKILYVSANQVNAQVAFETPVGQQLLAVNNGNAPSAPVAVTVASAAPALFSGPAGALAVHTSDGSMVGTAMPARVGDQVTLYLTGLGQTNPPLTTGQLASSTTAAPLAAITATVDGKPAKVISASAVPGSVGLYQVVVQIPAGVTAGNVNVVVNAGASPSGAAGLAVAQGAYMQHNLVADVEGVADKVDSSLLDPWGISFTATGPFWISDHLSGLSTVYSTDGTKAAVVVTIPAAGGGSGKGTPTGQVSSTAGFEVAAGRPATFIFSTEDGTISGWNSTANATLAIVKVDNSSSGAVYKGLAIGSANSATYLYAANFHAGTIDVFDSSWAPVTTMPFQDPGIPAGFAPFNIQNLGGKLYVTYAKQDAAKFNDVKGKGNGYVSVFDTGGKLLQHLASTGSLNSPWGIAIAPATFGALAGALLVGNFGDGTINAFDPASGTSLGAVQDTAGSPIVIPGLWALQVGNGGRGGDANTVYFAAGPPRGDRIGGLFGSLQVAH